MKTIIFITCIVLLSRTNANAQMPLLDKAVLAEGLWCFPLHGDSLKYIYLPYEAGLAYIRDTVPQFSYMRYVMNRSTTSNSGTLEEADGGGILNFLVLYNTPQSTVQAAEKILRRRFRNDSIRIRGPLIFERGRYSLISSIITGDSLVKKTQILSAGNAPVLENSRVALSFGLTPLTSSLLMQNFKMTTPDISVVFDMEFSALTEDYDAELEIDWTEVKKSQSINAGGSVYYVSADVKLAFDEMIKNQAIKLKVNGSNAPMEALLNTVYEKLLALMFQPVQPEQLPERQQNDLLGAMSQMMGQDGMLSSRQTTGFGLNVGYQLKELKSTGKSRLLFKGRSTVQRHHYITFNIGDLYKRYGHDKSVFTTAPLMESTFQRRSVAIGVDGDLEKEFDKMLNSITVILNKQHLNGQVTEETMLINKDIVKNNQRPALVYGNYDDSTNWLQFKQRTVWQFKGGAVYESDWKTQDAAMINLYVPFKRKTIRLEGDMQALKQQGVRAISVQITYPFFTREKQERITLGINDSLNDKIFEITQPNNQEEVQYIITWIKTNGQTLQKTAKDKIGIIFIDEVPI